MKSLTVHNIEYNLMKIIEKKADEWDLSLNKTIKKILRQQLLNEPEQKDDNPFKAVEGKWSKAEHKAFTENTAHFNRIDDTLWQ